MRILLINPTDKECYGKMKGLVRAYPPTSLLFIASIIKKYRKDYVKILDFQLIDKHFSELDILKEKWDIVGITSMTQPFPMALKIAEFIKEQNPNTKTIFGGSHISAIPNEIKHKAIDFLVIGEGEKTIINLLNAIENSSNLSKVKGIAYKSGNKVHFTPPQPLIKNLDELPFLDYSLINLNDYSHAIQKRKPLAVVFTSRGCPNSCIFCSKAVFGRTLRLRDPKKVVDEVELLVTKHGVKEIRFTDDGLNFVKEHTMSICKEIIKRKLDIVWKGGIRADNCDFELFNTMKKSGCYCLGIGVESGNQMILDSIKKNITLDQVKKTVKLVKKVGIETLCYFMLGFPNETNETLSDTVNFAKELGSDISKFGIVAPLPGTELYSNLVKENKLLKEWSDYKFHDKPVFKLDNLKPEDVLRWYKKAYRSLCFNPSFIIKSLKKITNPVELKGYVKTGFIMLKMLLKKN